MDLKLAQVQAVQRSPVSQLAKLAPTPAADDARHLGGDSKLTRRIYPYSVAEFPSPKDENLFKWGSDYINPERLKEDLCKRV